ncbi:virulence protein SciE type [Stieleria sp. TO1_6]|uniref:type VI secretion system accessory protein TagJ n=1 Tax=Stieleria tagensis TaxID=2956795 RepID=UPI00209A7DEE|nr:type VI secretion system accessory protein TagJ [Stieleria tagensis]MCO8120416.1 virulence protein SciE type [Stieleria tagensis]
MQAEEYLRDGKLDEAFAELKRQVQSNPSDGKYRVFLFQMLTVVGKWDSALTQLEIAGDLDPGNLAMVQAYREAIRCESKRSRVFAGESSPLIFGQPDRWLALMIEALKMDASGQHDQAQQLRDEAFESAPTTAGQIEFSGEKQDDFQWIADADPRMGPVLEALLNGQYYWIPFHRIAQIDFEAPADLRDFVWTPVHFTWANGGESVGMIPTRYPGSDSVADPMLQLSRKTDWKAAPGQDDDSASIGIGQRMLATDHDEYALLDIRKITLDVVADDDASQDGSAEPGDEPAN